MSRKQEGGGAVSLYGSSDSAGAKEFKFVFLGLIFAVAVFAVSGGGASAAPDVNESTVSADVISASNDSFILRGETMMIEFELTELPNGSIPEATLDFWSGTSKTASRNLVYILDPPPPFFGENVSRTNITRLWSFYYVIKSVDPNADYLELDVGNVCNSSGGCSDPSAKRINVSVISRGSFSVSNTSNFVDVFRKTESGGTLDFSAGVYRDVQLTIDKPLTLVSDTGDYRTSGVVFTGNSSINVNSDDVSVRGFRFENITPSLKVWGSPSPVIRVGEGSPSNLRFEKNEFTNITESSLWFPPAGIQLVRNDSALAYNRNVLIADNKYAHSDGHFIHAEYVSYSVFEDNVVDNASRIGISLEGGTNVSVLNNGISNTGSSAIEFLDSVAHVKGNVIENADLAPHEDGSSARGAIVFSDGSEGIIENNTITGNHDGIILCSLCDDGFIEDDWDDPEPVNFIVRNNIIHSNVGTYDVFSHNRNPTLQAAYNYWGSSDGPNVSRLNGSIIHVPYSSDESRSSFMVRTGIGILSTGVSLTFNMSSDEEMNNVLRNVTLNVNGSASDLRMVVSVMGSEPPTRMNSSPPSRLEVYNYLEINLSESVIDNATIIFAIPTSWLTSNRVDKNNVVLMRLSGGRWENLETSVVSENVNEVTFSAVTPGFSFFAVAGTVTPRSSSSRGRSSGGGSVYIPAASTFPWLFVDRQAVNVVSSLSPDAPFVFSTSDRDVVVTSVAVKVNTETRNAVLVAASLRSRPSSISAAPEGTVYRYFGVATDNVNKAFIDGITTTFAVSKEWMSANNAGNSNIVLFAYDGASSSWVNAGARMTNETAESVLFEAETRGSEIFAIVSQGEKTETETPAEPEAASPPAEPETEPEAAAPEPETIVLEPSEPRRGVPPLAVTVIVVLAAGIAVFAFARYYKKKRA